MLKRGLIMIAVLLLSVGVIYRVMLWWYGMTVTSWWRTPFHNSELKAQGSMDWSLHQIGWAFDVVPDNGSQMDQLYAMPLPFGKLIPEGTHIHAQIL